MLPQLIAAKKMLAVSLASVMLIMPAPQPINEIMSPIQVKVVDQDPLTKYEKRQMQCLAENMYFEAGNQSEKGMIAVTNVVLNRANDHRFPDTACGVIHQKSRGVCQFSWTCSKNRRIRNWDVFDRAKRLAEKAVKGKLEDVTNGAKFYHASYVNPGWKLTKLARIGTHIFYRG